MAYLNLTLAISRLAFIRRAGWLTRTLVLDGTIDDSIQIAREGQSEFIDQVRVTLVGALRPDAEATVGYVPTWTDADGQRYPGHLEFNVSGTPDLVESICDFRAQGRCPWVC